VTVLPTCAVKGRMECYCDLCGHVALTKAIEPTGNHTPADSWTIDSAPTCSKDGVRSHHCTVCGAPVDSETLPAQPDLHTYSVAYTVDAKPTCISEGSQSHHCIYCEARTGEEILPIDPKAHSYSDEWIVTKEATCSESGLMHQVCLLCGEDSVSTLIPKTEHTYGDYEIIKESADGLSAQVKYTCLVCGHENITVIVFGEGDNDDYIGDDKDNPLNKIHPLAPVSDSILVVDSKQMIVSNIARQVKAGDFVLNFVNRNDFALYDTEGNFVAEESFVGTGFRYAYDDPDGQGVPTDYALSVTGDVDSDGKVTSADARLILRAAAGLEKLENAFFVAADVDTDGRISAQDARKTLRVAAYLDYFDATY
ncbi:MAG: dockerin type I repeat-containing protein, partial [Clostridiales bacterium]|nr:dockerin type I repeat-containing protein [Clostridiales bacterium]